MQIEHLREFLILEKTRNFSEAAKILHISQSSLSKHIAALEDEVDVDLFKRLGNTLQLTEAGSVFLDGALILVNDHNSFVELMKAIKARNDAVLEIGYLSSVASFLIGPLYEWLAKNVPDVHPRVHSMGITEMQANLESKVLNYAIALDIYETGDWHSSEPIYDEEFFVVLPPGHRLAEHDAIRRVDLASEVFLIPGTDMPVLNRKLDYALGMLPSYLNGTIYKDVWAVLEASRGHAVCAFDIADVHLNAQGSIMGGAIFTLADFALAIACNMGEAPTVAATNSIQFLSAAKGTTLTATCDVDKSGRSLGFYTVDVVDDLGTPVAKMIATCFRRPPASKS